MKAVQMRVWSLFGAALLLAGCERPPVDTVQRGYRGTGMVEVYNPRTQAALVAANQLPEALPPAPAEGPRAKDVFKNVQVLGDQSVAEFTRTMTAITAWVAPKQGCDYCHTPGQDLSSDALYTKVVARKMLEMTRTINADWKNHVAETGVTCFTCHRGQNIPENIWFTAPQQKQAGLMAGNSAGQNTPAASVTFASLPYDPFTPFLLKDADIRVLGSTALPTGNRHSIKQTEWTYSLMTHMSDSLGVNCTYCHNSRSFQSWDMSTPQRETAWYGIRMVRGLNNDYMLPLTKSFPPNRLGPTGDVGKVDCATCHQGVYKPLFGNSLLKGHPELVGGAVKATMSGTPPSSATATAVIVFFAVNSTALPDDGAANLKMLVVALQANPAAKLTISGYHSTTGTLDVNQELAKQRAFAVRDALKSAGIADDRLVLEKPLSTEGNIAGEDPQARRVEVTMK
jgi:photosynthetic reaction center cytochrome c subunit